MILYFSATGNTKYCAEFLEALEFKNVSENCCVYGVFTCGSISGDCADTLKSILEHKNMKLNAAFVVVMPDNYVPIFRQKSEETKQAMLKNADVTLNSIVHDINGKTHTFMKSKKLPRIAMFIIRKFFMPSQRKVKGFSVNDECISCGLCVKVCRQRKIFESKHETVR